MMHRLQWIVGMLMGAFMLSPAHAAEILHHTTAFQVDPAGQSLSVQDTLVVAGNGELVLTLSPNLTISKALMNGQYTTYVRNAGEVVFIFAAPGNHTLELAYGGESIPFLGPEGSFLQPDWLAHAPDQRATWEITGESPKGQKFVLSGTLEQEDEDGRAYSATYQIAQPGPAPALMTGPFDIDERMVDGLRIRTYFHPELAPLSQAYLEDAARYIELYSRKVGPYPYPSFSIVSGPAPVGWGLPGMTYMGRRVLALPFIRTTSLPHEVLHNWWGNAVEIDYASGNWAEGLTTYQADHAMAEAAKPGGGKAKRMEWLRNYAALPVERDHPVTAFRSKVHDASQIVGYGKTAFVFHMLKVQLGADAFTKALQRFFAAQTGKIAGWSDIRAAFEAESGQDLGIFFDIWLTRTGAPELAISDANRTADVVTFTVEQRQKGAVYPLTLTVAADDERHMVNMAEKVQTFTFSTSKEVSGLTLDPDTDIFRRLHPDEAPPILRDISLDARTQLVALGDDDLREEAAELAAELLQARLRRLDPNSAKTLIVAGPNQDVRAWMSAKNWASPPNSIADKGDARAWTFKAPTGQTVLAVEAENLGALQVLSRVLPHYKRRSYVVMENETTIDKGTWEPAESPLIWKFSEN